MNKKTGKALSDNEAVNVAGGQITQANKGGYKVVNKDGITVSNLIFDDMNSAVEFCNIMGINSDFITTQANNEVKAQTREAIADEVMGIID